jgi:hypothetical protein
LDISFSGYSPDANSCERGNEPSGSISLKGKECLVGFEVFTAVVMKSIFVTSQKMILFKECLD